MEKHKEVFFVIRLHSAQSAASLAVSFFHVLYFFSSENLMHAIINFYLNLFSLSKIPILLSIVI